MNEAIAQELRRPLDAADILSSLDPDAARLEVRRLRAQLRYLADKDEFKKRKNDNKWRRGSFGHIDKAESYWDEFEKGASGHRSRKTSNVASPETSKREQHESSSTTGDAFADFDRAQKAMKDLNDEMMSLLDTSPKGRRGGGGSSNGGDSAGEASSYGEGNGDSEGKRAGQGKKLPPGSLDHRLSESGVQSNRADKQPTKRRSFVLDKGLVLVDSDSEGEHKGAS